MTMEKAAVIIVFIHHRRHAQLSHVGITRSPISPLLCLKRQVEELAAAQLNADELNELPVSIANLREAAVKLVGKAVLKLASEKPEELETLASFTELLLASEENEIRRSRLQLARQCFDYDPTAASLEDLPRLRPYLDVVGEDESLSQDEKIGRVKDILFGWKKGERNGSSHETNS